MINENWDKEVYLFLELAAKHDVRMVMVGGGAVNFHGYQRHSADVDFWLDLSEENLQKLKNVLSEMGFENHEFPDTILKGEQNISLKFSPVGVYIELITSFSINKSFEEAYNEGVKVMVEGHEFLSWRVLNLDDLILSKIKSGRPKDLLDIQELVRHNNK